MMRRILNASVLVVWALALVAVVSAFAQAPGVKIDRFPLDVPIQEQRVLYCLDKEAAMSLAKLIVTGDVEKTKAYAVQVRDARRCTASGLFSIYRRQVYRATAKDGAIVAVYQADVQLTSGVVQVYPILLNELHEDTPA